APMERLRSPSGLPTKVPYVFANMLRKLEKEWSPDYLAVVFDLAAPTFRDELYKEYKAQRPPMPEDLVVQLPMVRRLCEAMRLPVVEREGYEADDVIGTLSRQAGERGLDVFIVTADKDMLQLVRDQLPGGGRIRVLNPGKGDLLADEKKVEELMGVPPDRVPDVMALMGDSIDNIPGAKGIGEKGARELIRKSRSSSTSHLSRPCPRMRPRCARSTRISDSARCCASSPRRWRRPRRPPPRAWLPQRSFRSSWLAIPPRRKSPFGSSPFPPRGPRRTKSPASAAGPVRWRSPPRRIFPPRSNWTQRGKCARRSTIGLPTERGRKSCTTRSWSS